MAQLKERSVKMSIKWTELPTLGRTQRGVYYEAHSKNGLGPRLAVIIKTPDGDWSAKAGDVDLGMAGDLSSAMQKVETYLADSVLGY